MTEIVPRLVFNEAAVDRIFAQFDQELAPGAAIGIAINGWPVYAKGFGLANVELPVRLSPSMRMRIGSTTKHFTALAYLLLCEEGRASIEDPLGRHLPDIDPGIHDVPMWQLMSNVSGLLDATDLVQQFSGVETRLVRTSDLLELYRARQSRSAPAGETFIYNNGGWVLLSVAIERIAGLPLEQVMEDRIFSPVGMTDTIVRRWDFECYPNSASGHRSTAPGRYARGEYCGGIDYAGAGAVASTVDDMLKWLAHMDRPVVGSEASWQKIRTPCRLPNGVSTGYGFGLFASDYRGLPILFHAGGGNGSSAQMIKAPDLALDLVVMSNRSDVSSSELAERVLDTIVLGLEPARTQAPSPGWSGLFASSDRGPLILLNSGGAGASATIDGFDFPLSRDSKDEFSAFGVLASWRRSIGIVGALDRPTALRFSDFGTVYALDAVEAAPGSTRDIVGRYRHSGLRIDAVIADSADGAFLETTTPLGSARFALEALAGPIWHARSVDPRVKPIAAFLRFDTPNGFSFSNILTRNLDFRREG